MLNCNHNPILIASRHGSSGNSRVTVCRECGEIKITADKDGIRFTDSFSLWGSYELLAASQAYRLATMPDTADEQIAGKKIWRPLDFGGLRLYQVLLHWRMKDGKEGTDVHIVAADSPNQTPHSAANQIKEAYREGFDNNPEMSYWDTKGYALNVLMPMSWAVNGIRLIDAEVKDGDYVPGEWKCPRCQMRLGQRTLSAQDGSVGVNRDPEPPDCMNTCGVKMTRVTWRDAAHEAYLINQRCAKEIRMLKDAWPEGAAMPIFEDSVESTEESFGPAN